MTNSIVHKIAGTIEDARYFSLMADEVTDSSNREQVVICLCWIDEQFDAHEDCWTAQGGVNWGQCINSSIEGCLVKIKFISL